MDRKEQQKKALEMAHIPSDNKYLLTLRNRAKLLIDCQTCFHDGDTWSYSVCYDELTCEKCPTKDECNASLCLLCMFADDFYTEKCEKESLFFHRVRVVRFEK